MEYLKPKWEIARLHYFNAEIELSIENLKTGNLLITINTTKANIEQTFLTTEQAMAYIEATLGPSLTQEATNNWQEITYRKSDSS